MDHSWHSYDGHWIAFFDNSTTTLKKISVLGGPAVTLGKLDAQLRGASWGEDGTIVFATARTRASFASPQRVGSRS